MAGRIRTALLALGVLAAFAAGPARAGKLRIGQPAPDFKVTTLDGKTVSLADFKGQVLVLNFWATWCGPCRRELPLLDAYYRIQEKYGLRVLAVTTEDSGPISQLKPLAKVLAIPMARRFQGPYGPMEGVPTNYVIDRNGVLRYAQANAFTLGSLNDVLVPLLVQPAPDAPPAPVAAGGAGQTVRTAAAD